MNFRRAATLLGAAAALIGAQFFLFGKFLTTVAPPVPDVSTLVGLASMISLVLLLLASLWGKNKIGDRYNNIAIAGSLVCLAFAVGFYLYYDHLEGTYVYRYPPSEIEAAKSDRYIRGHLHDQGRRRVGERSVSAVVSDLGGPDYVVSEQFLWTEKSQRDVGRLLIAVYLVIVIFFGAAIYLLLVRLLDSKPATKKK